MMGFFNDAINRALEYPVDGGPVASVYVSQEKVCGACGGGAREGYGEGEAGGGGTGGRGGFKEAEREMGDVRENGVRVDGWSA